jgi:hypothetical protein
VGTLFYDVYPDASNKFSLTSKISASVSTYNAAAAIAGVNALSTIITATTDATIAIWYDQSGNGVHVLSSSATAKIITAGSIVTMNGQPTIKFSSTDSFLSSTSTVNYSSQSGATVNAIAQNESTTSWFGGIIGTADAGGYPGYNITYSSREGYESDGHGCEYGSGIISTDPKMITNIFINSSTNLSKIYVNSVLKTNTAVTTNTCSLFNVSGSVIHIGAARGNSGLSFNGNISEAIIFPKQLVDGERNPLETNQTATYFAPGVSITSSATNNTSCSGSSVTFTANIYNFTSTPTYQWTKNGIAIPGANSATYSTTTLSNNDQIKVWVNAGINNSAIVSNGLLLNLDASNPGSYAGTGSNWYDLSGNNNHATLMNSPTYDAASGSIVTNGSNQYISVPQISTAITNVTMQAWVYVTLNTKGPFIKNGTAGGGYAIGIGDAAYDQVGSNVNMLVYGTPGWINTSVSYGTTGWKLVTMTMDGTSTARAYVNGSLIGTYATTPNASFTGALNFGANIGDQSGFYNGKFAAAYFYNRALSLTEIQQNYNAFATKTTGYGSNTITNSITGAIPIMTVVGDGCVNKTTLTTSSGLTSYAWYKDDVVISGATSNTYTPSASGVYQVQVSNGTCSNTSAVTTIYTCAVDAYGRSVATSNVNSIISQEGGANFGTGRDFSGKLYNTTGLTTTSGTIGSNTAILGGVISPTNFITSSIGVIYSTDASFGTYSTTTIQSNVAAGSYSSTISGLNPLTTYFAKSFIVNKAGTSYGPQVSFTTPVRPIAVGDSYGGGIVIYILQTGDSSYNPNITHGLIAARVDLGTMGWNNGSRAYTNANNIGSGIGHTSTIIAQSGSNGGTNYAAKACDDYTVTETVGGITTTYSDWYLGSTLELQKMMLSQSYLSGLNSNYYWASNEQTATGPAASGVAVGNALYIRKDQYIDQWGKTNSGTINVRAIRMF